MNAVKKRPDLSKLDSLILKSGTHRSIREGACFLEAAAYFAGQPFTDHPPCVSPVIGAFGRTWNDALNDTDRQMLKPYILKVLNTATTPEDEERRAWLATDWLVRTFAPAWFDLAGLTDHATALRALPELTADELATAAQATISAARNAAESAAWSAAGNATWNDARNAARSAAGSAAWSAARSAAGSAAGNAAWSAARSAAGSAAGSAAWNDARNAARSAAGSAAWSAAWSEAESALAPTVQLLQASARDLLDRLIEVGRMEA